MAIIQEFKKEVAHTRFSFPFRLISFMPLCYPKIAEVPKLFWNTSGTGEAVTEVLPRELFLNSSNLHCSICPAAAKGVLEGRRKEGH